MVSSDLNSRADDTRGHLLSISKPNFPLNKKKNFPDPAISSTRSRVEIVLQY